MAAPRTVRRILTLKNFGVFRNFTASADLPDFRRHNLIYGFNGSGKTTLARLFASLETGALRPQLPEGGTFEVELSDGTLIQSTGALDALKGRLLVFSVDFIEENLRWKDGTAKPVFYLGREQAELSERLAATEGALLALDASRPDLQREYSSKDRALNGYKRDVARSIAEQLALGRRYDASDLVADYGQGVYGPECLLSEGDQRQLRTVIIQDAPLPKRQALISQSLDLAALNNTVRTILRTTLGAMALEDLRDHDSMLRWIREGVDYHTARHLSSCLLCGNTLTEGRISALAHAIDSKFDELSNQIVSAKGRAEALRDRIAALQGSIPSSNDIVKGLQLRLREAASELQERLTAGIDIARKALALLERKMVTPNLSIEPDGLILEAEALAWDVAVAGNVADINSVIADHNRSHDEFHEFQNTARAKLKAHLLAHGRARYVELQSEWATAKDRRDVLEGKRAHLVEEVERLKKEMRQHGRAADMINRMIYGYLGHKELEVATLEEGYQLRRNGQPVSGSLSEGEKTAIALCYFLSTVEAEGRKRKDLIVVVDDPISSLDTRALNYAFSIIKGALSDAGQLIVLTHNLQFMNETKKWLRRKTEREVGKEKATATLLFLDAIQEAGSETRASSIKILPTLIREYESEYHYLFHLVLQFSRSPDGRTGYFYVMPNALRKVLEIFLAFKMPGSEGLSGKVENVAKIEQGIDAVRIRALDRLVQVESHADSLDDLVTFSSMTIEETKAAADALLNIMETMDKGHYDRLCGICG